jgi:hypothetical protein
MIILQKNYIGNNYFQMKFFHLLKRKKHKKEEKERNQKKLKEDNSIN